MSYKTYENYKDSNLSYVGEIPINWEIGRVKHILDYNHHYPVGDGDHGSIKPEMYQDEGIPYIRVQNLSWGFDLNLENIVYISNEINNQNKKSILKPKDILIAKTGATVGKLAIIPPFIPQANTTSSVGKITVNHDLFNYKYYAYLFLSNMFRHQIIEAASQKSAQPGFNIDDLIEFNILIPPKDEQNKIESYLDKKTSDIEDNITKTKNLITLLEEKKVALINQVVTKGLDLNVPMKDSGIEWIGEISEHFDVKKLKFLILKNPQYGANCEPESDVDKFDYRYIRITDINENAELNDSIVYLNEEDAKQFILNQNDILFARSGATVGKTYLYDERDGECCFAGYLIRYVLNKDLLDPKYLLYYTFSKSYSEWIKIVSTQATIQNVSAEKYNNLFIPLPNINEQKQIVNFLNYEISKIDKTIEKIQENIDLLNEYKVSLIYHVVTGKIDVRDEA